MTSPVITVASLAGVINVAVIGYGDGDDRAEVPGADDGSMRPEPPPSDSHG